jgi:SNF2 family DNA or RNA helicase
VVRVADATVAAEVALVATGEGVVVAARDTSDRLKLRNRLQAHLEGAALRTDAGSLVRGHRAAQLLDGVPGVWLNWDESARRFAENRRDLPQRHHAMRRRVLDIEAAGADAARSALGEAGDRLDDHQAVNVHALADPSTYGMCLFDEQGAGKTVSVLFAFDRLVDAGVVDAALIVAPKAMVPEWSKAVGDFLPGLYSVSVVAGDRQAKKAALAADADVTVTNFESVANMEGAIAAHARRHGDRILLVVDESFVVKNIDARRTQAVRRVREWCGRCFVLCGTPAPNAPRDVVEQVTLADLGAAFGDVAIPAVPAAAEAVVSDVLETRAVYLRSLKVDVLPELPDKTFHVVRLDMSPEQQHAYIQARDDLVLALRATDEAGFRRQLASFAARRTALLQLCSNPAGVLPGYSEIPAKLDALDRLLNRLVVREGEKVVVWSFYVASLEAIAERYAPLGLVRYDGSVASTDDRREAVRRFQEDPATRVFVGNPAAAGAGITLHSARYAIYESMSNQAAHYLQSLDRIHRRGQAREVEYYVLLCDDTIEEAEFDRLRRKEATAGRLLGDAAEPAMTRDSLLQELLGETS